MSLVARSIWWGVVLGAQLAGGQSDSELPAAAKSLPTAYVVFADCDADGDVDQEDFACFQRCIADGTASIAGECEVLDRNGDGVIDHHDLQAFLACQSGPAIPADPRCERWPSGLASDDFNSYNLDGRVWSIVDPLGDARISIVGTNSGNARLSVRLPAHAEHNIWTDGVLAPHLLQATADTDFELQVRFESVVEQRFQGQGLIIMQDADTFLLMQMYRDHAGVFYFAGAIDNASATQYHNALIAGGSPAFLRVTRKGDQWTGSYSFDGSTWTHPAQFGRTMQVTQVGLFAANPPGAAAPPFEMLVDYFINTAAPFRVGDDETVQDTLAPNFVHFEAIPDGDAIGIRWSTDEPTTGTVDYGLTDEYELGKLSSAALSPSHFHRIAGLNPGTYYLRVTATDAADNSSRRTTQVIATGQDSGGPDITLWYGDETQTFGHLGVPQPAADVLGNVQDAQGVSWFGYSLNGGPMVILNRGPNTMRLALQGDFVADLPYDSLQAGSNQLLFRAIDGSGNIRLKPVNIVKSAGNSWPLPYAIDWSQADSISSVAQVVDGNWILSGSTVRPAVMAYDRLIAIGDLSWTDCEVSVPITVYAVDTGGYDPPSYGPAVGIVCRWPGHSDDGRQPLQGVYPLGGIGLFRWTHTQNNFQVFGNNGFILAQAPTEEILEPGTTYQFKLRVETSGSNVTYRFNYWPVAQPEPAQWKLIGNQALAADPGQGSVLLLAHHVDATFGNVTITPGPFP